MPETRTGYSLLEMITAMVVFGILAAIAYPAFRPERYQVDATAEALASSLLAAQRLAVSRQHDVAVTFQPAAGRYRIHEDADNDGSVDGGERVLGRDLGEGVAFGPGGATAHSVGSAPVTFTLLRGGNPTVVFHRSGSASEEGGVYLTQAGGRDAAVHTRLLLIDRATGRTTRLTFRGGNWVLMR